MARTKQTKRRSITAQASAGWNSNGESREILLNDISSNDEVIIFDSFIPVKYRKTKSGTVVRTDREAE